MEFIDENMVTEGEQGGVPELDFDEAHRKQQEDWEIDEEAIFGGPLLEPYPQSSGSILAAGVSTSNELTPDAEQAIQDASGMSNDEYNYIANYDNLPINQDSSCHRTIDNDSSHGETTPENDSASSDVREDVFDCQYCGQRWSKLISLNKHIAGKHKEEREERNALADEVVFRCTESGCESVFLSEEAVHNHFAYAHDQGASKARSYSCRYCSKKYDISSSLHSHYARTHPNQKRVSIREDTIAAGEDCDSEDQCDPAPATSWDTKMARTPKIGRRNKLASVMKPNGINLPCSDSSEDEEEKEEVPVKTRGRCRPLLAAKFKKECPTPASNPLKCDMCRKSFVTSDFLHKHKLMHAEYVSNDSKGKLFCEVCGQVFTGEPYILRHKNTTACGNKVSIPIVSSSTEAHRNVEYSSPTGLRKRRSEAIAGSNGVDELAACRPSKLMQPFVKKGQQSDEDRSSSQYVSNTIVKHGGQIERKPPRILLHNAAHATFPTGSSVKAELTWNSVMKYADFNTNEPVQGSNMNNSETNSSGHSGNVQCSSFPLSTAIFERAAQFPEEVMIAWSTVLDADMLAAANMNSSNTILCVQELEPLHLPQEAKEILLRGHIITLTMLTSNDTTSQWSIITFGEQRPPAGLKNKLFTQFQNVENIFIEDAATRNMDVVNILRYTKDGLFTMLSKSFAKKTIGFNYQP